MIRIRQTRQRAIERRAVGREEPRLRQAESVASRGAVVPDRGAGVLVAFAVVVGATAPSALPAFTVGAGVLVEAWGWPAACTSPTVGARAVLLRFGRFHRLAGKGCAIPSPW